jgi:Asp-tRNA(Asn)/Glu-tRNA(Gln) amidotransferase A subunit family amidase
MELLHSLTATQARSAIADGRITSEALVAACLERIAAREPLLGAWQSLDAEAALDQARACDREPTRGLLHGVPVGIKDIIDTADLPTEFGTPIYAGHRPAWDAACVAALRGAGAVILGKTVTTELAYFKPAKTANPHDLDRTPGGSSSGSAAAVADCMVPLALGTQTVGSVIRPAAFCGVFGYKGTYGLFNMGGIKAFAPSLDTLGGMARDIADLELLNRVLVGAEMGEPQFGRPPRIGLCRTHEWHGAAVESRQAVERAANLLAEAGATVAEAPLPPSFANLCEAQATVLAFEGARSFFHEWTRYRSRLSSKISEMVEQGLGCDYRTYAAALAQGEAARREIETLFARHDVLLAPSAVGEPPAKHDSTGDPLFSRLWTLLHVPCINLPGFSGPSGLPVGVQLIAARHNDRGLLAVAAWAAARIEQP